MKQLEIYLIQILGILAVLLFIQFSACKEDCDGTGPSLNVTNYCDFDVSLEVDVIGDSLYTSILQSGDNQVFYPHETKVKIKAGKASSLISLSRTKNFEAQNCKSYTVDLFQNDSSTLYRLNLEFDQHWN